MKYYKVRRSSRYSVTPEIKEVNIERVTEKSVWIDGSRHAKKSEWTNFYPTREEAKGHLIRLQTSIRNRLEKDYKRSEEILAEIEKI